MAARIGCSLSFLTSYLTHERSFLSELICSEFFSNADILSRISSGIAGASVVRSSTGATACGVAGKDVLAESKSPLYEFMDLGFGFCRLCSAGIAGRDNSYRQNMKIATKYPHITKEYFAKKGIMVDIIKLYGSIELAPIAGLSDLIVDLVSTGETMRKNGLCEVETIMESTARLVANKSLSRAKHVRIKEFLNLLEQ